MNQTELDIAFSGKKDDDLKVTLSGPSEALLQVLIHGLPPTELLKLRDAFSAELTRRGLPEKP